jgi:hypothetical protein
LVEAEFAKLSALFQHHKQREGRAFEMEILSMGMSGDYLLALAKGSNMLRIGSLIFGSR